MDPEESLQTWDGVMAGERLRTMSCSDKVTIYVRGFAGMSSSPSKPVKNSWSIILYCLFLMFSLPEGAAPPLGLEASFNLKTTII